MNRWILFSVIVGVVLLITFIPFVSAAGLPTKAEINDDSVSYLTASSPVMDLVGFVNEAVWYAGEVGKEKAFAEFSLTNGSFTQKERYIWAYDFNGINLAHPLHPEFKGENKLSLTDPTGFPMIQAMRDIARDGSGFVRYQYENPVSGETESKLSYVKRVDDSWWLGSGIYGTDLVIPDEAPESIRAYLKNRVDMAVQYGEDVGKEEALFAFDDAEGEFATNGTYIFAFDMNGTTIALPFDQKKVGTDEANLTDINGVSIGGEKLTVARDGGGFWYYVYNNPKADNKPEFKVSYIQPVDEDWVVGTGIYLPDISVEFSPEHREKLVSQVWEARVFVEEKGIDEAIRTFNDREGAFSDPDLFVFAFDKDSTLLANPFLPGMIGVNRLFDRDPFGKYPVRQMITNAENGGGFTYYFSPDPDAGYQMRLKLGYTRMTDDGLIVGAGIFSDI